MRLAKRRAGKGKGKEREMKRKASREEKRSFLSPSPSTRTCHQWLVDRRTSEEGRRGREWKGMERAEKNDKQKGGPADP